MPSEPNLLPSLPTPHAATLETDDFRTAHLGVRRFEGREAISELYRFDIQLVSTERAVNEAPVDPDDMIGASATLRLFDRKGSELRAVSGIISAARLCCDREAFEHATYELTLVPRAHLLTLVTTQEIFLDMSVLDIIREKLSRVGLGEQLEMRTIGVYPAREFVVQYMETDLAFISRLAEHVGLSFHFEQTAAGETIVFSDHNEGKARLPLPVAFSPRGDSGGVKALAVRSEMIPALFVAQDYNYQNPDLDVTRSRELAEGSGGGVVEFGSHHTTPDEAQTFADTRAEEYCSRRRVAHGESEVGGFTAGTRFTLLDYPYPGDRELLLSAVSHHFEQTLGGDDAAHDHYQNVFSAIPCSHRFRPARVTPRPRIHGVLTAVVQTLGGAQIGDQAQLDADGRYTVQLHCDTAGTPSGKASHRIRMAKPFAGPSQGMHFPLRPGTEVLLAFINGDPDRPVIVGAVPNAITPSVVAPGNAHMHRIQSHHGLVIEFGKTLAT